MLDVGERLVPSRGRVELTCLSQRGRSQLDHEQSDTSITVHKKNIF